MTSDKRKQPLNRHTRNTVTLAIIALLCACTNTEILENKSALSADQRTVAEMIESRVAEQDFSGVVLVTRDGKVLMEAAFDNENLGQGHAVGLDSQFAIASITKSFTAVLVLQLVERGQLSLDDTIASHLPTFSAVYSNRVTVRHLLQNRSGIPHYVDLPGWFDSEHKANLTRSDLTDAIAALPLKFEPGSDYLYSNANYFLLGMILDQVASVPYETLLAKRVLRVAGQENTRQLYGETDAALVQNFLREKDGGYSHVPIVNPELFRATASLSSTAYDLMRFSAALEDDTLLSQESRSILFDVDTPMAWSVGKLPMKDGSLMRFQSYNGELVGYTSMITRFPDHDAVIIVLNNDNVGYDWLASLTLDVASFAFRSLNDH